MSFDSIPEDLENKQPCPKCEHGNAVEDKNGNWSCDTCDWCYIKGGYEYIGDSENNQAGYIY